MKLAIQSWSFHSEEGFLCEVELEPEFEELNHESMCQEIFGVSVRTVLEWKRTALELFDQLEDELAEAEKLAKEYKEELEEERRMNVKATSPIL